MLAFLNTLVNSLVNPILPIPLTLPHPISTSSGPFSGFSEIKPWKPRKRLRAPLIILKHICLLYEETPSHGPIPPIVRMARWPKTAGELEGYISAESVRTIRKARELCFVLRTTGAFIGRVDNAKSE